MAARPPSLRATSSRAAAPPRALCVAARLQQSVAEGETHSVREAQGGDKEGDRKQEKTEGETDRKTQRERETEGETKGRQGKRHLESDRKGDLGEEPEGKKQSGET
jgi:hypothetical protein